MSLYALQTDIMLQETSQNPIKLATLPTKQGAKAKSPLPSKRKRDDICGLGAFNKVFTIKPCPESPYDKPRIFKPIRIIGRSQLPLSFLDTSDGEQLSSNRLFSAHIDVLERHNEAQDRENEAPRVLIARYETKRTLYAVERVKACVYSLCKLAGWLKEKEVAELWNPEGLVIYPRFPKPERVNLLEGEWWKHAVVNTEQAERPAKRIRMSMLRSPPKAQFEKLQDTLQQNEEGVALDQEQTGEPLTELIPETTEFPTPPTPQEQLETLVDQYTNAIYMSKTSLAYFAKGPIARIRNTFTSPEEGAPPTHEFVSFLRSMLLSHKAEEKKYREKLPEVIKAIPPGSFSDDELVDANKKPKKSKRKVKLSREGMYPQEADIVKKWWVRELATAEMYGEETIDQRIKRRLADLRVRETLAQMILMLEIISLEALSTYKAPLEEDINAAEDTQAQGESQAKPKKRKRKLDDVNLLLDLLLDKLCIWQSVEQEGVLDFDTKPSNQDTGVSGSGQGGGNDRLQSFCIEVIIPFYMNRLPEQARMVNKKLGGPANHSPPKRKAMKPPITSRKSGESKEPDAKKSRRALGRVATDTMGQTGQQRTAPSLNRSATDSALMNVIKREGSEVPLSSIPFQRSPSNAARRSMSQFKHLKGREIDLTTTSAAATAKMKQKKRVEDDLREAITALKRPNRGLAAASYADENEKRGLGLSSKSKKPANTVRKVIRDIQVTATPRTVRRAKDMIEQTPIHQRNPFIRPRDSAAPPSSDFCIPSSAARPASSIVPSTIQRSVTARTIAGQSVTETPSKPSTNQTFLTAGSAGSTVFATPSKPRALSPDSPVQGFDATPTKTIASSPPNNIMATPRALFVTPRKSVIAASIAESPLPTFSNATKDAVEPSIYDALGWNDDDEF